MMGFWFAGALAVVLILALLFRPYLLKPSNATVSRRQLNAAIYRDQLERLDGDRAENTLAESDYAQARAELQRRVIDDTADDEVSTAPRAPRKTMLAVGLAVPIAAVGLYLLLGNPAALDASGPQHKIAAPDMERLTAGLAKKLEQDPGNLQGWAMLARSYKMLGRNAEAEQAFDKAGAYLDNDAQLLAIYADLAATNADGNFAGKPLQLIQRALKVDPENAMALWLAGTAAFRGGQFEVAVRQWEKLMPQIDPASEDGRMLQDSIAEAYAAIGKTAPTSVGKDPSPAGPKTHASVRGQVELDAALKALAAPGDTVMVIARVPGARVPVAVVRAKVTELPLPFVLDDSLAMSAQSKISMADQVEVEARISKSGMAQPESGDLVSAVQTVKVGATGISIRVTKVRP